MPAAQPAWMSAPRLLPKRCVGARERDYIVPRGGRAGAREVPTQEGRRTPDARHSEWRQLSQWTTVYNVDVRAAAAATSTAPKRATRQAGAMCATCKRRLDVTECNACHTKVHGSQRDRWIRGGREGARRRPWIGEGRTTPATLKWRPMSKRATKEGARGQAEARGGEGGETGARGGQRGRDRGERGGDRERREGDNGTRGGRKAARGGREGREGARGGERGARGGREEARGGEGGRRGGARGGREGGERGREGARGGREGREGERGGGGGRGGERGARGGREGGERGERGGPDEGLWGGPDEASPKILGKQPSMSRYPGRGWATCSSSPISRNIHALTEPWGWTEWNMSNTWGLKQGKNEDLTHCS